MPSIHTGVFKERPTPVAIGIALGHDIEVCTETVLVRSATPHLVTIGWAKVCNHDCDFVTSAGTRALTIGGNGASVRQLVTGTTATAAPAGVASVVEQSSAARGSQDTIGTSLPLGQ